MNRSAAAIFSAMIFGFKNPVPDHDRTTSSSMPRPRQQAPQP
ncbi:MAG TPA: hypothetical protein VFA20_30485 [Myxococcaceae bacterium]|nr:hypothetical protein [Myxococcaceae bacterium]